MFDRDERVLMLVEGEAFREICGTLACDLDIAKLKRSVAASARLLRLVWAVQEDAEIPPGLERHASVLRAPDPGMALAVEAMTLADRLDHVVLCANRSRYATLLDALRPRGLRLTLMSTRSGDPAPVSAHLRRAADRFIDLAAMVDPRPEAVPVQTAAPARRARRAVPEPE